MTATQKKDDDLRKKVIREVFKKRKKKKKMGNSITAKKPEPLNEVNADLTFFERFKGQNRGYKYLFLVVDIYSRYAWGRPLKTKKAEEALRAFRSIFEGEEKGGTTTTRYPKNLTTDNGGEFKGPFSSFCAEKKIVQRFVEKGDHHSLGIIDRLTRTIREELNRIWGEEDKKSRNWIKHLPLILKDYNEREHTTTKEAPVDILKGKAENRQKVIRNYSMYYEFRPGDRVRKKLKKKEEGLLRKGTDQHWTKETYKVKGYQGLKVVLEDGTRHAPRDLLRTELSDLPPPPSKPKKKRKSRKKAEAIQPREKSKRARRKNKLFYDSETFVN